MAKEKKENKEEKITKQQPKTKKKTVDKWKKKTWYTIVAPQEFEAKEIGETIVEKAENLMGRIISVSGRDLANQPKKQHIHIRFKVINIVGNKAHTDAIGHMIKDNYMKRVVRRKSSKIMIVKDYPSSDGIKFKIKTIIVTEKKASGNQKAGLMKKTDEMMKDIISKISSRKIVDELVFGTIPNKIYPQLKKIVPV